MSEQANRRVFTLSVQEVQNLNNTEIDQLVQDLSTPPMDESQINPFQKPVETLLSQMIPETMEQYQLPGSMLAECESEAMLLDPDSTLWELSSEQRAELLRHNAMVQIREKLGHTASRILIIV